MKFNFLVSIIINNYNYGHFVSEAIDSALNQTYSQIEVIVVDDGSTDNSRKIIASYEHRITSILKENGGQASALNAGFAATQGDIICFLDADDIFLIEKLKKSWRYSDVMKILIGAFIPSGCWITIPKHLLKVIMKIIHTNVI
jgi:glycosyltransferase involved in cell wall biosynthesis